MSNANIVANGPSKLVLTMLETIFPLSFIPEELVIIVIHTITCYNDVIIIASLIIANFFMTFKINMIWHCGKKVWVFGNDHHGQKPHSMQDNRHLSFDY